MMRRVGPVDAPLSRVRGLFHDVEAWPRWMPGMNATRVLERESGKLRVGISQSVFGRTWNQTVAMELTENQVRVRTLDGWLQWSLVWSFHGMPGGDGTTVSLEFETRADFFSRVSQGVFLKINDRRFDETLAALAAHAGRPGVEETGPAEGRTLLVVYETRDGFDVWYDGRRYTTLPPGKEKSS